MSHKSLRVFAAFLVCAAVIRVLGGCNISFESNPNTVAAQPGEYLFCFWNVENLFDDKPDKRSHKADKEFDSWMSGDRAMLQLKLSKLTEALLALNDGRGPDILATCEVECPHAAELLMQALNNRLDSRWHYQNVIMKDLSGGRHIAPAIITRLPVQHAKTRMHGRLLRILEGHLVVDGKELAIFATHWTSRIQADSVEGRDKYADTIYKAVTEMYRKDPGVDVLICGDFNDTPQDESVTKHLHSSGDANDVRAHRPTPLLYNLFAGKDASRGFGTHYYNGKWFIFDQILVSPGMLNEISWSCDPASGTTIQSTYKPSDTKMRPWRFGGENEKAARGYSDHFPVTVKLKVK